MTKSKKDKYIAAVNKNAWEYEQFPLKFQHNYDIALVAAEQDGFIIRCFPAFFKKNYNIALTAVKSRPKAFYYIDRSLKANYQIGLVAVVECPDLFDALSSDLQTNKTFILDILGKNKDIYPYLLPDFKKDPDVLVLMNDPQLLVDSISEIDSEDSDKDSLSTQQEHVLPTLELKPVHSFYAYAQGNRFHLFKATTPLSKETGDQLKSKILDGFITSMKDAYTDEDVSTIYNEFIASNAYKILAKGQGVMTRLFDLKTSSVKAVELIKNDALEQIKAFNSVVNN